MKNTHPFPGRLFQRDASKSTGHAIKRIGQWAIFICACSVLFSIEELPVQAQTTSPDGPEVIEVYLTRDEALQKAFPKADSIWSETWTPTSPQRQRIERRLGWRLAEPDFTVYQATQKGKHLGYAVITEQTGLYKPITFLVKADSKGRADGIWIMVYRESRGGEVRRQRFLSQYRGKSAQSPIRLNRDIIGVSGATLSVRALNGGVKKVLTILDVAYLEKK